MAINLVKPFVGWANKKLLWKYRKNGLFQKLEQDHADFYKAMLKTPSSYEWPKRPLYEWSRRVEYPFVAEILSNMKPSRILDVGSGVTFFPYYLNKQYRHNVECLDKNTSYINIMEQVCQKLDSQMNIPFHICDLTHKLPLIEQSYDAVISISVIEHINPANRLPAIDELWRVTKFGGKLIITLDVSLDGNAEGIHIEEVSYFLDRLSIITSSNLCIEDSCPPLTPQSPEYNALPVIIKKGEIIKPSIKSIYFDIRNKPLQGLARLFCLLIVIPKG